MEIKKIKLNSKQMKESGLNQFYVLKGIGEPLILSPRIADAIQKIRDLIFEPDYSYQQKEDFKELWELILKYELKRNLNKQK